MILSGETGARISLAPPVFFWNREVFIIIRTVFMEIEHQSVVGQFQECGNVMPRLQRLERLAKSLIIFQQSGAHVFAPPKSE